jgi:hypothetical protein
MTSHAPGFINVPSKSLDGDSKIAVAAIQTIAPTNRQGNTPIVLTGGQEVVIRLSHDDLVAQINEATGAVEVGTAEGLAKVSTGLDRNTQRLIAMLQQFGSVSS